MPLLKYVCARCGEQFEELVPLGREGDVSCPACGEADCKRFYQGKCSFGSLGKSSSCGGNCQGCKGCGT